MYTPKRCSFILILYYSATAPSTALARKTLQNGAGRGHGCGWSVLALYGRVSVVGIAAVYYLVYHLVEPLAQLVPVIAGIGQLSGGKEYPYEVAYIHVFPSRHLRSVPEPIPAVFIISPCGTRSMRSVSFSQEPINWSSRVSSFFFI